MKKEYKLVGKVTIPEKKRKEVKSIIQKILYLGGIREEDSMAIVSVKDSGCGIDEENQKKN